MLETRIGSWPIFSPEGRTFRERSAYLAARTTPVFRMDFCYHGVADHGPGRPAPEFMAAHFPVRDEGPALAAQPLRVGIHGATGRMGARLIDLIRADPSLSLGAAIGRPGHPGMGSDVGPLVGLGPVGVALAEGFESDVDVLIDFSAPAATLGIAEVCAGAGVPLVVGTTGLEADGKATLARLADRIAVLISPNTSRAVNLLFRLVEEAARALGDSADIEVVERHHRFKKDAPSGTALRLAEVAARAIGSERLIHGRSGVTGERPRGEIGIHALRTGDNPGEHTVVFGLMGECLELSHRALNRDGFARGALDVARFLAGKPPGMYSMADVLG